MTTETTAAQIDWTRTAPAPLEAWRKSLKVGDRVGVADWILVDAGDTSVQVEVKTVVKITPSGQICTEAGNGQRFVPPYYGQGHLSIFPLVEEAPAAEAAPVVEAAPTSQREGTITVIDSPVRVMEVDGQLLVQTPYSPAWNVFCRDRRARWDSSTQTRSFDLRDRSAVETELKRLFGTDGSQARIRAVDVRLDLDYITCEVQEWEYLGRVIASRKERDWSVKCAAGVVVIKGGWERSGGSKSRPQVTAKSGTVIEVRGVPLEKALATGERLEWEGISLVKREADEPILDQGLGAPKSVLTTPVQGLPELKHPRGYKIETWIIVQRQADLAQLDSALEEIVTQRAKLVSEEGEDADLMRAVCDALTSQAAAIRAALTHQPYAYWMARSAASEQPLFRVLLRAMALATRTPGIPARHEESRLLAPSFEPIYAAYMAAPRDEVSAVDTSVETPEAGAVSVVDTAPSEVLLTPDTAAPAPARRTRKRDINEGLVDAKPVRGADILVPALIPFAQLDSTPVSAADVSRLRATLGLTTTQFGTLLGSSRQRVYVWETEGTASAHGSISALIRLYLAQLPPVEHTEEHEETQAEEVDQATPEELKQDDRTQAHRTQAQPELLDAQPPRAARGGAWGFGWWREEDVHTKEWHLYYKTPYQADLARALERTPQAAWDKLSQRWELPDTEESARLLEGLVRAHWGFELKDVVYLHLDDVGRSWRAPVGELWELSRPRKDTPDGVWGRVIAGQVYREQSDGWHDGWHAQLWVRRVGEEDEGACAKIEETRAKATALAEQLRQAEEQSAADADRADAILADWAARGLTVKLDAGYNMPLGDYTLTPLLRHHTGRHSYNDYGLATGTLDDGLPIELGQVHGHIDSDWWDTAIYVRAEDADRVRVAQVCSYLALRRDAAWRSKPRIEQLHDACEAAREHYTSRPEYLAACEAALTQSQAAPVAAEQPPVVEGIQRAVWGCRRRQDAARVGSVQLTFLPDAQGQEWMVAVAVTRVGELRRNRDQEADPHTPEYSYDVEYRAATAEEIAALNEPDWLKARIGKRKV